MLCATARTHWRFNLLLTFLFACREVLAIGEGSLVPVASSPVEPTPACICRRKKQSFFYVDCGASVQSSDGDLGACEVEIRCAHAHTSTFD